MNTPERRAQRRLAEAKRREQLADTYIRDTITKHRDYDGHEITDAEIQAKRRQLLAGRSSHCDCGAPTKRQAPACRACRARHERETLADSYVRNTITKQAAKAGRPIPPGQVIPVAEIEAKRQTILAVRARRAAARKRGATDALVCRPSHERSRLTQAGHCTGGISLLPLT